MHSFGDVRSFWHQPLPDPQHYQVQDRVRDLARVITRLEVNARREAIQYSLLEMGRHGVDTRYLEAYLRWEERPKLDICAEPVTAILSASHDNFVGSLHSGDYQGDAMGIWRDAEGFIAVVMGYGSCEACCHFLGCADSDQHGEMIFDVQRELESSAFRVKGLEELPFALSQKGQSGGGSYYSSFFEDVWRASVVASETEQVITWFKGVDEAVELLHLKE